MPHPSIEGRERAPLLSVDGVHKRFGPVHALKGVDFDIYAGEVHALIGENGAGKSTLMKVLSGAHQPDEGRIELDGEPYRPAGPTDARRAGVAMIYQELTLANHLTVAENVTLGIERSRAGFVRRDTDRVRRSLARLGHDELDPDTKVGDLAIGTRQMVEIARALVSDCRIVIMDEPTSSLSMTDTRTLFAVIRKLREEGLAIVYISHFLEEVKEVSDRYTVLRDGRSCGSGASSDVSIPQLIETMVGRSMAAMYPHVDHEIGEPVIAVRGLRGRKLPVDVSFELHRGEILGVFGLVGSGRSEMARCLYGLDAVEDGEITLDGRGIHLREMAPRRALDLGIDLLSEDRKAEGLAQGMSIAANTTLSALRKTTTRGWIDLEAEARAADELCALTQAVYHHCSDPVSSMSGGNQQKVAIARMLHHGSSVLVMDEPTRGIDVGSKSEIYGHIQRLAGEGHAIIVISSYLPELRGLCDSLAVMHRGRLSPVRPLAQWTDQEAMEFATTGAASAA